MKTLKKKEVRHSGRSRRGMFVNLVETPMTFWKNIVFILLVACCCVNAYSDTTTVSGNFTANATWTKAHSPYHVTGDVAFYSGATLTIDAGVVVWFDSGTGMRIGKSFTANTDEGALIAIGTSVDSIRFTNTPGDTAGWKGIFFDNGSDAGGMSSSLAYCIVENAGQINTLIDSARGNILCKSTITPTVSNSIIANSRGYEVYCNASSPSFTQCSLANTSNAAGVVYLRLNSAPSLSNNAITGVNNAYLIYCDSTSDPTLTNNIFSSPAGKSIRVGIVSQITGNDFTNVAVKGMEVYGGNMSVNRQWSKQINDSLYIIVGSDIYIANGTKPTFTINAGITLAFADVGLRIAGSTNIITGKLIARGTPTDSIRFTSYSGNTNGWKGIIFDNGSDNAGDSSVLSYCIIENAGEQNIYGATATFHFRTTTTPVVANSFIRNGNDVEVLCDSNSGGIIRQNVITNTSSSQSVISLRNSASPSILDNAINGNSNSYLIYSDAAACNPIVTGNVFTSSNAKPVRVGALSVFAGNNFSGVAVKGTELLGSTITVNRTWPKQTGDSLYIVLGGDVIVRNGTNPTLTIDSGVTVKFLNCGLIIGGSTNSDEGILTANGSPNYPIRFTSFSGAAGGWKGIIFDNGSDFSGTTSTLTYAIIDNAGQANLYAIGANILWRSTTTPVVSYCTVTNSSGNGLYFLGSSPVVRNSKIYGNAQNGLYISTTSSPTIGNSFANSNDIYNNTQYDAFVDGTVNSNAKYNYWGTTSPATVAAHIFDKSDNNAVGEVFYKPFTDSARIQLLPDTIPPVSPAFVGAWSDSAKTLALLTTRWYNFPNPYFVWRASVDSNTSVAGYAVSFTADSADTLPRAITTTDTSFAIEQSLSSGVKYFFRLRVADILGNWSSAVTLFRYKYDVIPPGAPQNLSSVPANSQILLHWKINSENDVVRYRIFTGIAPNPAAQTDSTSGKTDTSKIITGLTNGVSYFFRVTAVDSANNQSLYSNEISASPISPPGVPLLLAPDSGSVGQPLIITLLWGAVPAAQTYHLQVSLNPTFATTFFDDSTIVATSQQIETLAVSANYYWRVSAKNAGGTGNWSNRWRFTTLNAPEFSVNKRTIDFGGLLLDSTKTDSVVVTNTGTSALNISSAQSDYSEFTVTPTNADINPTSSATFYISFQPVITDAKKGHILFLHNSITSPDSVEVRGSGITQTPSFSLDSSHCIFGNVNVDSTKTDSITITNNGTAMLRISSVTSTNNNFTITTTSDSIIPLGSKKFFVTFSPLAVGAVAGKIIFIHNAQNSPETLSVSGVGVTPGILLLPTTLNFGSVNIHTTKQDSFTVTNNGTAALVVTAITHSDTTFKVSPTAFSVAPGANKKVKVSFSPLSPVTFLDTLHIAHNAAGGSSLVPLTGICIAPVISVTPLSFTFGSVVANTSKQDSFTVTNTGATQLTVSNITSSSNAFSFNTTSFSLAPSVSRVVRITFTPTLAQAYNTTVTITHNAPGSPTLLSASGTGIAPAISFSPSSLVYGNVLVNGTKQDSFLIKNNGTAQLIVSSITSSNNAAFTPRIASISLAPNDSQYIVVTFHPVTVGTLNGRILFAHNAVGTPDTVLVSGTGVPPPAPVISFSPSSLSFGGITINTTKRDSFTITNTGTAQLDVTSITSSNAFFTVSASNISLAPTQSQKIIVTFAPTVVNVFSGRVLLLHNAAGSPDTVLVSGTATPPPAPIVTLNRASLSFGNVDLFSTKQDTFVIRNTGNANLLVDSLFATNNHYTIDTSHFMVLPNASHTVRVTFAPDSARTYATVIYIKNNAVERTDSVLVSGVGHPFPVIALPLTSINFDVPLLVGSSITKPFVIKNTGTAPLLVSSILSTNSNFTFDSTTLTIPPKDSETVTIIFTPTAEGLISANVTIAHNAAGSPSAITLSGIGKQRFEGGIETNVGRFTAGIPDSQWVLMSIPYALDNASASILQTQLTGGVPWKIYVFEDGKFKDASRSSSIFQLTRGFWFKSVARHEPFQLTFGAGNLLTTQSYPITIPTGWSLIGSPYYPQNVSWLPVNTTAGTPGIRVYNYSYERKRWEGPLNPAVDSNKLKPFGAYAVYNGSGISATFTFLRSATITPTPEWQSGDGWNAVLELGNATMRIGQHRNASNGSDVYDYPAPPQNPERSIDDGYLSGKLWSDIRSLNTGITAPLKWKVYINPQTVRSLHLKEVSGLPSGWHITIHGIPGVTATELQNGEAIAISKNIHSPFYAELTAGLDGAIDGTLPAQYALLQNYPNPFNPATTISFTIAEPQPAASLVIYDLLGRKVATLFTGALEQGRYSFVWEGNNDAGTFTGSGVYIARLTTTNFTKSIKMELVR